MQNILTVDSRQVSFSGNENHENSEAVASCGIIVNRNEFAVVPSIEELSVVKAKEALRKALLAPREAMQVFKNLEAAREAKELFNMRFGNKLPANITEVPVFHQEKSEPIELSDSAKATFARIGERAREAFAELQIERAEELNMPYELYGDNYYELMVAIDHYEYRLECADKLGINWDASEYDLVGLEQAIEEAETGARNEREDLRIFFAITRGMEA